MNTPKHSIDEATLSSGIPEKYQLNLVPVNTNINLLNLFTNYLFSKKPYNAIRFKSKIFEQKLIELLTKREYDIVQLEGAYLNWYIPVIRKYSKALISLRSHNLEHEIWEMSARYEHDQFKKKYLYNLARRIKKFELTYLNQYDVLLPITERDAEKYNQLGNHKPLHVTPVGFYPANEKINIPEEHAVFFMGSLDWLPNQDGLMWFVDHIWPQIINEYPDIRFYVAGRNAPEWLKKELERDNIIFLGEIDDAHAFMKKNTIMIVPLFSGGGMRVKIIEGMALGKTVVSTSLGAEGITCRHRENIIIADNDIEFIQEIRYILQNKPIFAKICQNAARFIRSSYNNHTIMDDLINFYTRHLK